MDDAFGFQHFLSQGDLIVRSLFVLLLLLSTICWYLIIAKTLSNMMVRKRAERFLAVFWNARSLEEMEASSNEAHGDSAFSELAICAMKVRRQKKQGSETSPMPGGVSEYLTRLLRNGIDQEAARIEHGLTLLASAGSTAPFIGLFGTVLGIYHALVQIGVSGQGSLSKVAGPVGESLLMTALGLAVAIPAVLAYNAFSRRNRLWLARLDNFAHDLYALVTVDDERPSVEA